MRQLRLATILILLLSISASFALASDSLSVQDLRDQAIASAIEQIAPSVVQIQVIGEGQPQDQLRGQGPTTGVLLAKNGWVITSNYRMPAEAASILVTFADRSRQPAQLLGVDHSLGLALLALDKPPAADITASGIDLHKNAEQATVGQTAIALGRVYRLDPCQPSVGIVSATNRMHGIAIQTDANVSPANYGGPLVSLSGNLLGIVTPLAPAILPSDQTGAAWYDSGIGFAVPPTVFRDRLQMLAEGQHLYPAKIGLVFIQGLSYNTPAIVHTVDPKGPTAASIKKGDIITSINATEITTQHAFAEALTQFRGGDTVQLSLLRDDQVMSIEVTLADKK